MITIHSKIDDQYLAEDMAVPNQLRNHYESYVLIPNLGPLIYSKIYRKMRLIIADLSSTIRIIEDAGRFKAKYKETPSTPFIPETMTVYGDIGDKPVVSGLNIEEAYTRTAKDQPGVVLRSLYSIGYQNLNASEVVTRTEADERMVDYRNLLSDLSRENLVVSTLVDDKLMLGEEGIVSRSLLDAGQGKQINTITKSIMTTGTSVEVPDEIVNLGKIMTDKLLKNTPLAEFSNQVSKMSGLYLAHMFDIFAINNPSDFTDIVDSCEWAFVRNELVTLDLQKPLFRGPLGANSISPESELRLTETSSRLRTSTSGTLLNTTDQLKTYNSISSEVQNKLGTLFDYGSNLGQTMSEQGFTQDRMESEKRTRVESALREISEQNRTFTLTTESVTSSNIREYTTEGKDPRFGTTELSFEVFSPVEVKHYLEDIGAVWCPRIKNPFLGLRNTLNHFWLKTYLDYILENYVVDPMEPIPSYENVSRVSKDTSKENESGTYTKSVRFSLTSNEINAGYLFGEDIQYSFNQHCDWYENCYDGDDYWINIENIDRHGGDSLVDVTIKYKVNNVFGNDPDRTWITVSIDKYKETEAYRQELQQYTQTVDKINPARRNAVKVQARKYATLKRDELIRQHEENIDHLKDYAFTALMRKMFDNNIDEGNWSYYQGIIRSCLDWEKSRMDPEPAEIQSLYRNELSPYHFLNVPAVRFFLNIKKDAEEVFFDTMKKVVDPDWKSLFDKVYKYIKKQRTKFDNSSDEEKLLDSYSSELILGRHLEAVLSNSTFSE